MAWRRPASIHRDYSLTVVIKNPADYHLWVMGEHVWSRTMPGGVEQIKNTEDYARIGSAGPFSTRKWKGDMVEIAVYDRALDDPTRQQLEGYMSCQYFPK